MLGVARRGSAGPTSTTGMPSSTARRTPARISPGRPVAAHRVDGDREQHRWAGGSGDVDGDAVLVPAAGRAHRVRHLGAAAARAHAARPARRASSAPARRLRVFDFDFFFLGTAIVVSGQEIGLVQASGDVASRTYAPATRRAGKLFSASCTRSAELVEHAPPLVGRRLSQPHGPSLRSAPQVGHSPAQSVRHSRSSAAVSRTSSRTSRRRDRSGPARWRTHRRAPRGRDRRRSAPRHRRAARLASGRRQRRQSRARARRCARRPRCRRSSTRARRSTPTSPRDRGVRRRRRRRAATCRRRAGAARARAAARRR